MQCRGHEHSRHAPGLDRRQILRAPHASPGDQRQLRDRLSNLLAKCRRRESRPDPHLGEIEHNQPPHSHPCRRPGNLEWTQTPPTHPGGEWFTPQQVETEDHPLRWQRGDNLLQDRGRRARLEPDDHLRPLDCPQPHSSFDRRDPRVNQQTTRFPGQCLVERPLGTFMHNRVEVGEVQPLETKSLANRPGDRQWFGTVDQLAHDGAVRRTLPGDSPHDHAPQQVEHRDHLHGTGRDRKGRERDVPLAP